jgi:hypothetical protein
MMTRRSLQWGLVAAAIALLAACGGKSPGGETGGAGGAPDGSTDPTQLCVDKINAYRATLGLPAYARWTEEEDCTASEAEKDAASNQPHSAFPSCTESAQNECPGWPGPPESMIGNCLAQMWAEGPGSDFSAHGHYINMSSTKYTKVACGFLQRDDGSVWAAQDFK